MRTDSYSPFITDKKKKSCNITGQIQFATTTQLMGENIWWECPVRLYLPVVIDVSCGHSVPKIGAHLRKHQRASSWQLENITMNLGSERLKIETLLLSKKGLLTSSESTWIKLSSRRNSWEREEMVNEKRWFLLGLTWSCPVCKTHLKQQRDRNSLIPRLPELANTLSWTNQHR